ncbi:MAG: winged helix-turn-helix transcriptional regulator [Ruminococcus sp.]|nr:winged helix-turn-helix transcriptional regulator [Ruminococcus sp.]
MPNYLHGSKSGIKQAKAVLREQPDLIIKFYQINILYHIIRKNATVSQLYSLLQNYILMFLPTSLRSMESDGIIVRTVYAQMPPAKELVSRQPCAVLLLE